MTEIGRVFYAKESLTSNAARPNIAASYTCDPGWFYTQQPKILDWCSNKNGQVFFKHVVPHYHIKKRKGDKNPFSTLDKT